jgi:hypothetical protein
MSSQEERPSYEEQSSPVGTTQLKLAALFVTPSPGKNDENGNQYIDDEPFIDKRKQSSMADVKGVSNNGEHTIILVTAKMIHSPI